VNITGSDIYREFENSEQFIEDWKKTCRETDGCSSGFLKKVAHLALGWTGTFRKYRCLCIQHDFDYRYGANYGMVQKIADNDLTRGVDELGGRLFSIIAWFIKQGLKIGGRFNFRDAIQGRESDTG
jgi:hypothetical protein